MKVIIINGPMGVGKTTAGKLIAEKNPGTAFIDGDWCMDIHPFVGNRETKAMAVDNILHMIGNYGRCSACRTVVLVWLMDDAWVREKIRDGLAALEAACGRLGLPRDGEEVNVDGLADLELALVCDCFGDEPFGAEPTPRLASFRYMRRLLFSRLRKTIEPI